MANPKIFGALDESIKMYLITSDCQISFDPVQIQSMTLASSTLQIRKHGYSRDLNIVICVGICTLPFYAINMDVVNLFTDSSFLLLANLHYIDVLLQLNE
ncbi:transmembrane protein, putative [Medicago truncatula]|uniref:Transmembrane protein, putative n=1 Tax=Medicago truncatula TaxID=3880 RepID=G7IHH6_MEDTR|nr:transmembrane protein, putative [Medicago truncatula]